MANQKGKRTYRPEYRECGGGPGQAGGPGENRDAGEEREGRDGKDRDGLSGYLCRIYVLGEKEYEQEECNNCKQ